MTSYYYSKEKGDQQRMTSYLGIGGRKQYTLSRELAKGGEGIVYELLDDKDHVAKIYKPERFRSEEDRPKLERKLRTMIDMKIDPIVDGHTKLAWPEDLLYQNGKFVGFSMPKINTEYNILDIYRTGPDSVREQQYENYTWKFSVQFAYNMAWVVNYVHSKNIVIGDLNQKNIAVDLKTSTVILLDCDSFDITNAKTGEHFPCVVGFEEVLAPELQQVGNLRNGEFTKESDNFSLAIHIFRLLMNNEDPFGGRITSKASQSNVPANKAIINGECLYVHDVPGKEWLPRMPKLDVLPPSIQKLFKKTFDYTALTALANIPNRATADEWLRALLEYAKPEPNNNLHKCAINPKHVYSAHNAACPWCAIENAVARSRRTAQTSTTSRVQNTPNATPVRTANTVTTAQNNTTTTRVVSSNNVYGHVPPYTASSSGGTNINNKRTRSAVIFFIDLIVFGMAGGVLLGHKWYEVTQEEYGHMLPYAVCLSACALIGLLVGLILACRNKENYVNADHCFGWLLMGFVAMLIASAVITVLGIAIPLAIYGFNALMAII